MHVPLYMMGASDLGTSSGEEREKDRRVWKPVTYNVECVVGFRYLGRANAKSV
jgi:hypothetical protein